MIFQTRYEHIKCDVFKIRRLYVVYAHPLLLWFYLKHTKIVSSRLFAPNSKCRLTKFKSKSMQHQRQAVHALNSLTIFFVWDNRFCDRTKWRGNHTRALYCAVLNKGKRIGQSTVHDRQYQWCTVCGRLIHTDVYFVWIMCVGVEMIVVVCLKW